MGPVPAHAAHSAAAADVRCAQVMPLLRHILSAASDRPHALLRAKALECISLVGMAVGREQFRDDAHARHAVHADAAGARAHPWLSHCCTTDSSHRVEFNVGHGMCTLHLAASRHVGSHAEREHHGCAGT